MWMLDILPSRRLAGREEGSLLQRHLHCAAVAGARPTTYDLVVSLLGACRYRILRTCITALVGQTYYASIHLSPSAPPGTAPVLSSPAQPPLSPELDIDARPSGAGGGGRPVCRGGGVVGWPNRGLLGFVEREGVVW